MPYFVFLGCLGVALAVALRAQLCVRHHPCEPRFTMYVLVWLAGAWFVAVGLMRRAGGGCQAFAFPCSICFYIAGQPCWCTTVAAHIWMQSRASSRSSPPWSFTEAYSVAFAVNSMQDAFCGHRRWQASALETLLLLLHVSQRLGHHQLVCFGYCWSYTVGKQFALYSTSEVPRTAHGTAHCMGHTLLDTGVAAMAGFWNAQLDVIW